MSIENTMAYIKDIAIRLNNPIMYGGVSLMVGAGFSKNAEGIGNRKTPPDWSELAKAMYDELYCKPIDEDKIENWKEQRLIKTSGKNTLHLAEEYMAFFDRNKMNTLIENNIADDMFVPGELHKRLLRLNWKDIFTTNYDTLLERTNDAIFPFKSYRVVLAQDNLPGSGTEHRIIKLHGSIPGVRPYIISEEDFRCYPKKSAAFVNTVQQALIETTLCMIGFSGDDPNFLSWHGWMHDNLKENCPQIYLIGLFGNMNESERDIFRKRKIALVDLSDLLDGTEKDKYSEAYSKFIDLIEAEKKSFKDSAPFYTFSDTLKKKIERESNYIKKILEFSESILTRVGDMVLLPHEKRAEYRKYFPDKFDDILLNYTEINDNLIHTISNLIKIQQLCLIPLYDYQAKKLIDLCNTIKEEHINVSPEWIISIYLYLLEMYRMDFDEKMYQEIKFRCEDIQSEIFEISQGLYHLELAKYAAALFKAEEVNEQLKLISKTNLKIRIAKVGLYIQLGNREYAETLLEECLNDLKKSKMDSTLYASYKSYLSLCYATLKGWHRNDEYSDTEYKNNPFQTRQIVIDMEDQLREEVLKSKAKDEVRENVFEVNFNRGRTVVFGENKLQRLSFEFVLMLDTLCLPLFTEQSILMPDAIKNIMGTSDNEYWKLSFMVRSNSKEVIERAFSRRGIATIPLHTMKELYNNIWDCVQRTNYKDFDGQSVFLSCNYALNVLSRMAVFLEDEKVLDLVKHLVKIVINDDVYTANELKKVISRLSTRFNGRLAGNLLHEIFIDADSRLCLASFFTQMDISITAADIYYEKAIELIKSKKDFEKDNGIAQLLCLWKNCQVNKYEAEIAKFLWGKNVENFPSSNNFYEMIWEELPHPDSIDFKRLYENFIYEGLTNHISNGDNFRYINLFYVTSPISDRKYTKIAFNNNQLEQILGSIENEVKKDEDTFQFSKFFDIKDKKQQIGYFNEFIAMVYTLKAGEEGTENILKIIERIWLLIKEKEEGGIAIEAVKTGLKSSYVQSLNMLKPAFWSNNKKVIEEAAMGLQLVLFMAKKNNQDITQVKEAILEIMDKLQYADIKYVKSIWNLLRQPIVNGLADDVTLQDKVAEIYTNCIKSYSYNGLKGDKYYFEAMYNCNNTLKRYMEQINTKEISVGHSLHNVVEYIKSLNIPELSTVWQ